MTENKIWVLMMVVRIFKGMRTSKEEVHFLCALPLAVFHGEGAYAPREAQARLLLLRNFVVMCPNGFHSTDMELAGEYGLADEDLAEVNHALKTPKQLGEKVDITLTLMESKY